MNIQIEHRRASPAEFRKLRAETNWGIPTLDTAKAALSASLCGVIATSGKQTIGMVRAVGDGQLNIYIQDVIITQSLRKQGIGKMLVKAILSDLSNTCPSSCKIGLFAAEGQREFYERLGFIARPDIGFGPGMHAMLSNLVDPNLATAQDAA